MRNSINILFFTIISVGIGIGQVPVPVENQSNPIALIGGIAHIGNGQVIQNSLILFDKGKISQVSNSQNGNFPSGTTQIDVSGKHIYPGFILPNSRIGLEEVSSIRAMSDNAERGSINPNVRSVISYNTDSEIIPTMRFNGVLLAESTPSSGIISGSSSVMEMEGWNWEDACHSMDIGIHLNWPARLSRQFDPATFTIKSVPNKNYEKTISELNTHFNDAASYKDNPNLEVNLKLEAMEGLFDGSKILFIHASTAKEMVESIKFAKESGVKKITLIAGTDALHASGYLKENNIPVILTAVHSLPGRADQDIDLPYRLPFLLSKAGVKVSLSHSGMLAHARNLPFYAGTAAAYGMDKEEALKTITSNTANALGISERVGTLEVGKDATLFVSEGDALDFRTNQLSYAFISGKMVVLPNKQQELFERFSRKYGHIK